MFQDTATLQLQQSTQPGSEQLTGFLSRYFWPSHHFRVSTPRNSI
ncbi:hypothetical protein [Streptomyces sp. NPDC048508]